MLRRAWIYRHRYAYDQRVGASASVRTVEDLNFANGIAAMIVVIDVFALHLGDQSETYHNMATRQAKSVNEIGVWLQVKVKKTFASSIGGDARADPVDVVLCRGHL